MIGLLNQSLLDILLLATDSEHVYSLHNTTDIESAHYVRTGGGNRVIIETSSDAISMHEISHVRQSLETGGLVFTKEGLLTNPGSRATGRLLDKYGAMSENEIEAYRIQYAMDESFPGTLSSGGINGIDAHAVASILDPSGSPAYPVVVLYSEDIKTKNMIKK